MPWRRKNLPLPRTRQNRWKNCLPRPGRLRRDGYPGGRWTPFLQSVRHPGRTGTLRGEAGAAGKDRAGRTGPDPGAGTGRAQSARTAPPDGPAVFRGDVPDPDSVGRGIRGSAGGGELPPGGNGQPAHPRCFPPGSPRRGSRSPWGKLPTTRNQTARLAWLADRLEPFLLPRGLRITVRALLGGRLLLDWL